MRSVREGERRWRKPRLGPGATTDKTGLCVRAPLAQTRSGLGSQGLAKTAEALAAIMYEVVRGRTRAEVASTLHTVSPGRNQYSCLKTEKKKEWVRGEALSGILPEFFEWNVFPPTLCEITPTLFKKTWIPCR